MSEPATNDVSPGGRRWLVALPLIGFIALTGLFCCGARRRSFGNPICPGWARRRRPRCSALEGPVRKARIPGLDPSMFKGRSVSPMSGHPVRALPRRRAAVDDLQKTRGCGGGINQGRSCNARRFLGRYGNPSASSASTATAAPRSSGCLRRLRLSWAAKAPSSTSWSAR
jgi:cytochrome c biogenesis protein CcmG/thiol:disulfide interchange protein DsbE